MRPKSAFALAILLSLLGSASSDLPAAPSAFTFDGSMQTTLGPGELSFRNGATTGSVVVFGDYGTLGVANPGFAGTAGAMSFPAFAPSQAIRLVHGASANGSPTAGFVNDYTLVYDLYLPTAAGNWFSFYQTNENNANDAEAFFRNSDGGIGIGSYHGPLALDQWNRVVFSVQGSGRMDKYINGTFVGSSTLGSIDGRWSLYANNGSPGDRPVLLFADDTNETRPGIVNQLGFVDQHLSAGQVALLGGVNRDLAAGMAVASTRQDYTFTNAGGDGQWNNPANWEVSVPFVEGDVNRTPNWFYGNEYISPNIGEITIDGGQVVTRAGGLSIDGERNGLGLATLNVMGVGTQLNVQGGFWIADWPGAAGEVNVGAGATLTASGRFDVGNDGPLLGRMNVWGTVETGQHLAVARRGNSAKGELNIYEGAVLTVGTTAGTWNLYMNDDAGTAASVINQYGGTVSVKNNTYINDDAATGVAVYNMMGGTFEGGGTIDVGWNLGGTSTLNVMGGSMKAGTQARLGVSGGTNTGSSRLNVTGGVFEAPLITTNIIDNEIRVAGGELVTGRIIAGASSPNIRLEGGVLDLRGDGTAAVDLNFGSSGSLVVSGGKFVLGAGTAGNQVSVNSAGLPGGVFGLGGASLLMGLQGTAVDSFVMAAGSVFDADGVVLELDILGTAGLVYGTGAADYAAATRLEIVSGATTGMFANAVAPAADLVSLFGLAPGVMVLPDTYGRAGLGSLFFIEPGSFQLVGVIVPEPGRAMLALGGLIPLVLMRRRRGGGGR